MTTLEQAARQALDALENIERWLPTVGQKGLRDYEADAIVALRQTLEQPAQQEPVLWGCKFNKGNRLDTFYTKGAAERFVEGSLRNGADVSLVGIYTEPPKRKWVGLTVEEIDDVVLNLPIPSTYLRIARVVEAKLKEKNA